MSREELFIILVIGAVAMPEGIRPHANQEGTNTIFLIETASRVSPDKSHARDVFSE